jgi:altronate hydrolase
MQEFAILDGPPPLHLHPDDPVAIARAALRPGQMVSAGGVTVAVLDRVPVGHKVALRAIEAGAEVRRYGQVIGRTKCAIEAGRHVHVHNLAFDEGQREYEFPADERVLPPIPENAPTFMGYPRADGRVGTRNYIAVAAASNCSAHVVELVAQHYRGRVLPAGVDGVVGFPHGEGCGHSIGPDTEQLERVLKGVLDHPNVAASVMVGLGCEINRVEFYPNSDRLTLQETGGTAATVEETIRLVDRHIERAAALKREIAPASKIVLGLNCGGSDSFSGITANPALGWAADQLARLGGAAVLAETPEIFGAEHLLLRRARNRAVAEKLLEVVAWYKDYLRPFGGSFDDNPSPGNKAGGLSNILEKSLGAVAKGGTLPLMDVLHYAERVSARGLTFMNTPGYDPPSLAGLGAGGVNLIAFTTGRGSAIGFPTVPVVKIASNTALFRRMGDNMDLNAGRIADGEATIEQVGAEILSLLIETASGRRSAAERLGHAEFVPWRIGPVL